MSTIEAPSGLTNQYPQLFEADPTLEATLTLADAGDRDALGELANLFQKSPAVDPWHAYAVRMAFAINPDIDLGIRSKLASDSIALMDQIKEAGQPGNPFLYSWNDRIVFGTITNQSFDLKRDYPGVTARLEGKQLSIDSGLFPDFRIDANGKNYRELVQGIHDKDHRFLRAVAEGRSNLKLGLEQIQQALEPTPQTEVLTKEQFAMFYHLLAVNYLGLAVEVDTIPGDYQAKGRSEVLRALANIVLGQPASDKEVTGLICWGSRVEGVSRRRVNSIEDHPPRTIRALLKTVGVDIEKDLEGEIDAIIDETTHGYTSVARQYGAIGAKDRIRPLVDTIIYA